jgi:hypothetical protein
MTHIPDKCEHALPSPSLPRALVRRNAAELHVVRDANGQALSYVCYESETGRGREMKRSCDAGHRITGEYVLVT